jgi:hypothetical protein
MQAFLQLLALAAVATAQIQQTVTGPTSGTTSVEGQTVKYDVNGNTITTVTGQPLNGGNGVSQGTGNIAGSSAGVSGKAAGSELLTASNTDGTAAINGQAAADNGYGVLGAVHGVAQGDAKAERLDSYYYAVNGCVDTPDKGRVCLTTSTATGALASGNGGAGAGTGTGTGSGVKPTVTPTPLPKITPTTNDAASMAAGASMSLVAIIASFFL